MRSIRIFTVSALFTLVFSISAAAQKGVEPLAPTATQAETNAWIVKTLGKNSTYHLDLTKKSITDIKFDGCTVSYIMRSETRGSSIDSSAPDRDGEVDAPEDGGGMNSAVVVKFSLAEMNGETIQVVELPNNKKMKAVAIAALGEKPAVHMEAKGGRGKGTDKPAVGVYVKADTAEAIKTGFAQAIKLCQPAAAAAN